MSKSSNYGQGTIDRYHNHPTCPPAELVTGADGKTRKVRPHHDCQGPYRGRIMVTVAGKRVRKTVYGKTRALVVTKLRKVTVAEGTGTLAAASPTMTVEQWMTLWLNERDDLKPESRTAYEVRMRVTIFPAVGKVRLTALTPEHVQAMLKGMRAKKAGVGTVVHGYAVLRSALTTAQRRGYVAVNVCNMIDPPSKKGQEQRHPLPLEDVRKVLAVAGDNPRWWVALYCGLRQGEALALRWCDVNLDCPVPFLTVRQNLSRQEGGKGTVLQVPKSDASTDRVVPLVSPVVDRLRTARAAHLLAGGTDDDFVFTHGWTVAAPSRRDYVQWCRLLRDAGVEHRPLHAARNTTAVLLEDAGVPDRVVSAILGHADVRTTYRYQAKNHSATLRAAAALDTLLSADEAAALKIAPEEAA